MTLGIFVEEVKSVLNANHTHAICLSHKPAETSVQLLRIFTGGLFRG